MSFYIRYIIPDITVWICFFAFPPPREISFDIVLRFFQNDINNNGPH
jgi:hypothetical protein